MAPGILFSKSVPVLCKPTSTRYTESFSAARATTVAGKAQADARSTHGRLAAEGAGGSRKQDSPPPEAAAAGLVIPPKDGSLGAAADAAVQHMAQEQELRAAASAALHSIE